MLTTPPPLVLTLKLDESSFDYLDRLRQQYFPPQRNFLKAHLTLFHALPGSQKASIGKTLQEFCSSISLLHLLFSQLRYLGQGVAIEVDCPQLKQLRLRLQETWKMWLSPQDRQGYRPHVTIQNKVMSDEARQLYEQLESEWQPFNGYGEGLLLWHYQGGPWNLVNEFPFRPIQ
jgi:2'-5' RNA ligase